MSSRAAGAGLSRSRHAPSFNPENLPLRREGLSKGGQGVPVTTGLVTREPGRCSPPSAHRPRRAQAPGTPTPFRSFRALRRAFRDG